MPTVLREGPYRFFFYAGDGNEPPHIHIERENKTAKIWLLPIRLQYARGFNRHESIVLTKIVEKNQKELLKAWNEYYSI